MPYNYETERPVIFTDDGQRMFLKIRDKAQRLLHASGAFRLQEVISDCVGDSWTMLACVDRMVELNEIKEITKDVAGQHRVFIAN